ncbi:extracellular solute-binding protein [Oharaeibacter diazotrophicus]|uniref:Putrescine-binding periplasmic protein n=1 Tax=Oharaeibacter diazotrophicus TaxID=1920512 RepID=A0A4R6RLY0_9HYPH|nr:extracellular solute-binding protein [Oharaeibacter diazotrophicus]TDP87135.1 spermidine/putrescine transport system substrate-binding protein [Oharaeibacter diazotrophicus]BBE70922.1 putrescine-binding periplasmic protein precursor [Pleomorphomonas sp. SM30]
MTTSRTLAAALAALLASTGLASAAGELNIYNWGNYTSPDMIKKFEAKYDVKVTITDYDSNDTALAKVRQGGSGFDIAMPSQHYIPIWIQEGLIQEVDAGSMENAKNLAPEFANPDFDPGRKYSVPWAWGTVGVSVNTDVLKDPVDSWSLIFDPPEEIKGKINVVPEMNDVIHAAIKYNGGNLCDYDKDMMRKVRDTLVNAKANWIAMEYSTIEKMVAGDYAATSDWNGSAMRQRLQNPKIHYILPKEGFQIWSDNIVVLKDAKNLENAKLFLNFMMDPENAGLNSSFHRYANGIAGSEKFMPADMQDAPELNIPADKMKVAELIKTCPPEAQAIYTKIWTELQK